MSAARSASTKALRQLSNGCARQQTRQLHMTGAASSSSRLLNTTKQHRPLPQDIDGLREECMRFGLETTGGKNELIDRLTAARQMSTQAFRRPNVGQTSATSKSVRHINTSRAHKAPKDTSTIDFTFLPDSEAIATIQDLRVPIVPTNFAPRRVGAHAPLAEEDITYRPVIALAAAESTHISTPSALADIQDNSSVNVDFHAVTEALSSTASKIASEVSSETAKAGSTVKTLWSGMMDDVFGPRKPSATA